MEITNLLWFFSDIKVSSPASQINNLYDCCCLPFLNCWWLVRVTLVVDWRFLPRNFWQVVGGPMKAFCRSVNVHGMVVLCSGGVLTELFYLFALRGGGERKTSLNCMGMRPCTLTFCLNQTFWLFAPRGGGERKTSSNCMGARPCALGVRPCALGMRAWALGVRVWGLVPWLFVLTKLFDLFALRGSGEQKTSSNCMGARVWGLVPWGWGHKALCPDFLFYLNFLTFLHWEAEGSEKLVQTAWVWGCESLHPGCEALHPDFVLTELFDLFCTETCWGTKNCIKLHGHEASRPTSHLVKFFHCLIFSMSKIHVTVSTPCHK